MKILFVYQALSTFVQKDLDILRSVHEVQPVQFTGPKGLGCNFFQDLWQLWQGVLWCDLTFSWFGKLHAFLAVLFSKILGKNAIVVAGGDDVTKAFIQDGKLGLCTHPIKKWFAYFTFRYADQVISISAFSLRDALANAKADIRKTTLIYHGFDPEVFKKKPGIKKDEKSVITVAHISYDSYNRKGLKLFVEAARLLPDYDFTIVGRFGDKTAVSLKELAPENVIFTGELYGDDLVTILSKALVYVQASEWESFGCSLAEAMLCECVPVVSNRTAIPEVVGDCGFYIDNLEPTDLADKIQEAMKHPEFGIRARQRIINKFPLEKRKKQLLDLIDSLGSLPVDRWGFLPLNSGD